VDIDIVRPLTVVFSRGIINAEDKKESVRAGVNGGGGVP